jgi:voltage-gated sodium channel
MFSYIDHFLRGFLESSRFQNFITIIIIINSILIGLETYPEIVRNYEVMIDVIDLFILAMFTVEIALKLLIYRSKFFVSGWNIFDFTVIAISILPAAGSFSIFRALRIVRTLRLFKSLPKLRLIIESLVHSIPSIGWIGVLLGIVYYIFAVVGYNLFNQGYPEYFGSLSKSFFTLFQIMTLESWSSAIARPIMDGIPYAAIYFVTFILIATYTTLNVFIAIVVNTMNQMTLDGLHEEEENIKEFIQIENSKVLEKLNELKGELDEIKGAKKRDN